MGRLQSLQLLEELSGVTELSESRGAFEKNLSQRLTEGQKQVEYGSELSHLDELSHAEPFKKTIFRG